MPLTRALTSRRLLACVLTICTLLLPQALVCGLHEHSPSHCCDMCHFGHLAWVQQANIPELLPPDVREFQLKFDDNARTAEQDCPTSSSRAPPAC